MEYWVYEFWDRFMKLQEKAVEPVIKTWSLNSNLRIGTSPELEAWHKRNIWFGVDHDMTKEALKYHDKILNSFLIGFNCESPEYLEMMDAYMKGTFFDFFYTKEFVYWIKKKIQKSLIMKKTLSILKDRENTTSLLPIIIRYPKAELLKL